MSLYSLSGCVCVCANASPITHFLPPPRRRRRRLICHQESHLRNYPCHGGEQKTPLKEQRARTTPLGTVKLQSTMTVFYLHGFNGPSIKHKRSTKNEICKCSVREVSKSLHKQNHEICACATNVGKLGMQSIP